MNGNSTIRLLMVSDELDETEFVTSMMRPVGYAVKATRVEDAEELTAALDKHEFDLAMHSLAALDLALKDTVEAIRARQLFLPVLAFGADDEQTAGKALATGAADRIQPDDQEQLRHALIREFDRVLALRRAHWLDIAYHESEKRAHALMESSRDAIAYIHDGMHVVANDAYLARFGYQSFDEVEGTSMIDMVQSDDQAKLKAFLREYSTSDQAQGKLDLALLAADGNRFQAEVEFARASIEGEACSQIIIRDQGNTEELEKQISLLARRDNVTDLFNRRYFMELLQPALDAAEQDQGESSLIQLALDDFESVKERVGVIAADRIIVDIAGVLHRAFGSEDAIARLDGATFAILCPTADVGTLDALAERVRSAIREHICDIDGTSLSLTATLGIARIDGSTTDANDILSRAQRAYEQARDTGPDAHRIYQPHKGELTQKQIDQQWIERIRDTLKNERLCLLFEPIVSLAGESVARYQVIFRLLDENGEPVEDPELQTAAERTGMSKGLDRWTILNSLKALIEQLKSDRSTVFFVPLSGQAFDDPGLFKWIHDRITQLKLPPGALVFELDADAAATHLKPAAAFAKAVHGMDCGVCIDGFGHGSDPFQVTRHVAADYLRIHEEFARNLATNRQNQEAISGIAKRAASEGKKTICPGVADAGTLTILWTLGPQMIQGEFLQQPSTERAYDFSSMAM